MIPGVVFIASDHAGFSLKSALCLHLADKGWKVEDLGTDSEESCDYPLFADLLCKKVLATGHKGILVCGSGIGMVIAANRHAGIRAALCTHESQARTARTHNDANVVCFGGRLTASALACSMAETFLTEEFAGGRHQRRVEQMDKMGVAL
jgi:ribose 5-phosphate isomerase B